MSRELINIKDIKGGSELVKITDLSNYEPKLPPNSAAYKSDDYFEKADTNLRVITRKREDVVWTDGFVTIPHNVTTYNKSIVIKSLYIKTNGSNIKLNPIVIYPRSETYNANPPNEFYVSDTDNILTKSLDFDYVVIEYSATSSSVSTYGIRNNIGENVILDHDPSDMSHNNNMLRYFRETYPDLWEEYDINIVSSATDPIANNNSLPTRFEPKYFELNKANLLLKSYTFSANSENPGTNPNTLKIGAHGNNSFFRNNITSSPTEFREYVIAVSAQWTTNWDNVNNKPGYNYGTSYGYGVEFFEDLNKLWTQGEFTKSRFSTHGETNIIPGVLSTTVTTSATGVSLGHSGWVYRNYTGGDNIFAVPNIEVGTKVWFSNDPTGPSYTIKSIIDENTIELEEVLPAQSGKYIYFYSYPGIVTTLLQNGTFYRSQEQSMTCSIVGAKLKKIKLLTGTNWQIVREAARITASLQTQNPDGSWPTELVWDMYRGFGYIRPNLAIQYIKDTYTENPEFLESLAVGEERAHGINSILDYDTITENTPVTKKMFRKKYDAINDIKQDKLPIDIADGNNNKFLDEQGDFSFINHAQLNNLNADSGNLHVSQDEKDGFANHGYDAGETIKTVKEVETKLDNLGKLEFEPVRDKLAGIEDNANNYVHPATHPPEIIEQDANNRFVTDAEKSTWNGKQNDLGFTPENAENKQNSLTADGTGEKYPTVDAVNEGLALKADTVDVMQNKQSIATLESILSDVNVNQEAQVTTSGVDTVSLPKTAANTGMQVQLFGTSDETGNTIGTGRVRSVGVGGINPSSLYFNGGTLRSNGLIKDEIRKGASGYELVKRVGVGTFGSELIPNGFDLVDTNSDGLANGLSIIAPGRGVPSIVSGNGFARAQRLDYASGASNITSIRIASILEPDSLYKFSFKYRSNFSFFLSDMDYSLGWSSIPINTGDASLIEGYIKTNTGYVNTRSFVFTSWMDTEGEWAEIGEITLKKIDTSYPPLDRYATMIGNNILYTIATPIITPIAHAGLLNSNANGAVYFEPAVADAGVYGANIAIQLTDFPISAIESISKYEDGVFTPLNTATAVIAVDGLSFTHPDLASGDLVTFTYLYNMESTGRSMTLTHYDSRYVVKDTANADVYKITPKITSGTLTWELTLV